MSHTQEFQNNPPPRRGDRIPALGCATEYGVLYPIAPDPQHANRHAQPRRQHRDRREQSPLHDADSLSPRRREMDV
jgi:hypothetical protein